MSTLRLLFTLITVACWSETVRSAADDSGTELVLAFMIHRHGDRTPTESSISYSTDVTALEELVAQYGYGQLTDNGIRRGYDLGQFIRSRYGAELSPRYNRSEIYIRSTDSTRTKMTVLAAMAAVFPGAARAWSDLIDWVPTPYTTVPAKYDFNLAYLNCPVFTAAYYSLMTSESSEMDQYAELLAQLADAGYDITSMPAMLYAIFDVWVAQKGMGLDLTAELEELLPAVEVAAGTAMDVIFGNDQYVALQAGVLLNEFFEYADSAIAGDSIQKVRVYSAHDINVFSLFAVSQARPRPGVPKYGSLYALELRRVIETGQYVVQPVYLKSPEADVEYPQFEGCDDVLCDYDQYKELVSSYLLNETEWRTQCEFDDDADFDTSSID